LRERETLGWMLAYVHARDQPPDEWSSPAGGRDDPIGIVLGVWLWAMLIVMMAGFVASLL
jgi:hypothetical protein